MAFLRKRPQKPATLHFLGKRDFLIEKVRKKHFLEKSAQKRFLKKRGKKLRCGLLGKLYLLGKHGLF